MAFTGPQALEWLDADTMAAWKRLEGTWVVISDEKAALPPQVIAAREDEGIFKEFMAQRQATAVVVRPDRYVYGFAVDASSLRRLVRELHQRVFGNS